MTRRLRQKKVSSLHLPTPPPDDQPLSEPPDSSRYPAAGNGKVQPMTPALAGLSSKVTAAGGAPALNVLSLRPLEKRPRVTITDLAQMLGMDKSSVSLALRDSPKVSSATRARVR